MKRKINIAMTIFALIVLGSAIGYIKEQEPKIWMNRCSVGVALFKGGYRDWAISYCHGFNFDKNGREKHYYHAPKFSHSDIRPLLAAGNKRARDYNAAHPPDLSGFTNRVRATPLVDETGGSDAGMIKR